MTLESFANSYAEARGKFLAAAHDAKARINSYGRDDLKGSQGEHLTCDVAMLGPENAERAAIVITGTHGCEGFAGSAILHRWLISRRDAAAAGDVKIVLVHAINPWAFSHQTRTTENNVDLNRNFIRDNVGYERQNTAYDALAPFLHIDPSDARRCLEAYRGYKSHLDQHGWHLENEMLEGQCHRPDGLFYAGKEPEWSNRLFRRIAHEHLAAAETIGFIDWHTGVGSFGEIVYLIFDERGSPEHAAACRWWDRQEEKSAFHSGSTPKYRGLLSQSIRQELPAARIAGAAVEIGTADEYSILRGDCLDRWLRFEGRNDPCAAQFQAAYKNIMCPDDLSWRRMVLSDRGQVDRWRRHLVAAARNTETPALLLLARIRVTARQPQPGSFVLDLFPAAEQICAMPKHEPDLDLPPVPDPTLPNQAMKGRGAVSNRPGRYELGERPLEDDGWSNPTALASGDPDGDPPALATKVALDSSRTIMAHNQSPDVPFDRSVNTYRGCEHGCIYCFARPTHAYLGLSPGLDFESKLFAKADAAKLLAKELRKPGYKPDVLALGAVTDVYQPIERQFRITRSVLKVLSDFNHPVGITTKSARVLDDLDLIADMAKRRLIMVSISVTSLDRELARKLEPRASTPPNRLNAIKTLSDAGVPVAISVAPIIPAITDHEIESIIAAGAEAGAKWVNWTLLRLPLEIKDLFIEWLVAHAPGKAKHAMSLISQCHGGIAYRSQWGTRMKGEGPYADIIRERVEKAARRHGLDKREYDLDCTRFTVPKEPDRQFELFC